MQAIMVFYLHVKFEIDWSNGFQVRVRKPNRKHGQTDTGHINLIGGLVTRNPPKKLKYWEKVMMDNYLNERIILTVITWDINDTGVCMSSQHNKMDDKENLYNSRR